MLLTLKANKSYKSFSFPGGNSKNACEIKNHAFFKGINWTELKNKQRRAPFKPTVESEDDTRNFSEEFTKQPVIDSPAPVPSNTNRLFRGYSYVAPQHLNQHKKSTILKHEIYCNKPIIVSIHFFLMSLYLHIV